MMYIGVDLGLSGGIVILDENQRVIHKYVMPIIKIKGKSEYDIKTIVQILQGIAIPAAIDDIKVYAVLEKSHVRPISGKRACFTNGFGYGLMQGILESIGISYEIVKPQTWMKELEIDSKDKKGSILFCQRKWPDVDWRATERCTKVHDGLTDGAGLALYCYRRNK